MGCGYRERLCLRTTATTRIPKEEAENCGYVGSGAFCRRTKLC